MDLVAGSGRRQPLGWISEPFAVDSTGTSLPTWFEASGSQLRQIVDATDALPPIIFDPTYSFLNCAAYFSNLSAYWYLNLNSDDTAYCPILGMLDAYRGYRPVFGFETNVAREYGLVIARQDGSCSFPASNTGPSWDFELPCQAHDYCYDLRGAGFSGTISDADCDNRFLDLMNAHCKHRVLSGLCYDIAYEYWLGVRLPWVVTNPDPGPVQFRNLNSLLCMDVYAFATSDNSPVVQWGCNGFENQQWHVTPAGGGAFRLEVQHSLKCADTFGGVIAQWSCISSSQVVEIRGAFNTDVFTVRRLGNCFDVPASSKSWGVQLISYPCFETGNQLWFIAAN